MKKHSISCAMPWGVAAAFAAALSACGGGGSDAQAPAAPAQQAVTLDFTAVAGSTPVACGAAISSLGSTSATAQLKDLRFYIANVTLLKADGSEVPLALAANDDWNLTVGSERVSLIDLEDATGDCAGGTAATNARITGTVPTGRYTGVKMTLGVPYALNHSDSAAAKPPLDVQAMAWSWQSGRKFAKVEFTDPAGAAGSWPATSKTFNFHLGATGCTGNPATGATVSCTAGNRMDFHLHSFDVATQKIAIDVQALLAGTNITANAAGAPGCMSGGTDPECLHVFEALKIDWKADGTGTGLSIDEGHGQTLFKAVAR